MHKKLVWLKVSEMSKKCGLSKFVIRRLIDDGTIRGNRLNGHRVVLKEWFEDFMEDLMSGRSGDFFYKKNSDNEHLKDWDGGELKDNLNEDDREDPGPSKEDTERENEENEFYFGVKKIQKMMEEDEDK